MTIAYDENPDDDGNIKQAKDEARRIDVELTSLSLELDTLTVEETKARRRRESANGVPAFLGADWTGPERGVEEARRSEVAFREATLARADHDEVVERLRTIESRRSELLRERVDRHAEIRSLRLQAGMERTNWMYVRLTGAIVNLTRVIAIAAVVGIIIQVVALLHDSTNRAGGNGAAASGSSSR